MTASIISSILKRKKYGLIALVGTLAMAGLSYYLTIVNVAFKSFFVLVQMDGVLFTTVSMVLSLIISILFGSYLGLLVFRRDLIKGTPGARTIASGLGGTIAGVLGAACPTCGAPLLALFGAPLALMALPFQGLEIKAASVLLLLLSIHLLAQSVEKKLKC